MTVDLLLVLPLIIPLVAAIITLLTRSFPNIQRGVTIGAMGFLLVIVLMLLFRVHQEGIQATQSGGWPAPYGILLVADHLSAIMLALTGIIGFSASLYAVGDIDPRHMQYGLYPLFHLLMAGICGAFLTSDLFNLYVWFEILLVASFALVALGNKPSQLTGAIQYTIISLVGSSFLLFGIGFLYGLTGTLNMADLALQLKTIDAPGLVTTASMLFIVAFGLKAAVFPFFFWLPAAYPTPPVTISATFAGLLTKVGVYALLRVFTLLFTHDVGYTHTLLLWIAGLTMVTGVLGAVAQDEFRRILSFHHISQIGYMVMGLALLTPLALIGSIFYIVHYVFVKTNLFFISGLANRIGGTFDINMLGGLYRGHPLLSALFVVAAFSLAGVPPLSGFWAKFILAKAGLAVDQYIIVATALTVGLLTLFSMLKIWQRAFLAPEPTPQPSGAPNEAGSSHVLYLPVILLAALTIAIGLYAGPLYELSAQAADELLHPARYIEAVLQQ